MSTPTRDLHDNLGPMLLMTPATAQAADSTPISVDLLGYRSAMVMIWVGVGGITFSGTNRVDFVLEHSTDNSAWAAVAQADIVGATVTAGGIVRSLIAAKAAIDAAPAKLSYVGGRRYIRLTADFSGTHGAGTPMTAFAVRGDAEQLPIA
jgi:hypothetical protein